MGVRGVAAPPVKIVKCCLIYSVNRLIKDLIFVTDFPSGRRGGGGTAHPYICHFFKSLTPLAIRRIAMGYYCGTRTAEHA